MTPVVKGLLTGLCASLFFTPIGGLAIGLLAWHLAKKEAEKDV